MAQGEDTARDTSPEIIAATADGMTLVYTGSPLGVVGRVDITDPANPEPLGNIDAGGDRPPARSPSKCGGRPGLRPGRVLILPKG